MDIIKRVLIKISGEALAGEKAGEIYACENIKRLCLDIKGILNLGVKISIVIGGGNIIRGRSFKGLPREDADYMGMMATAINGMALRAYLATLEVKAVLMSSLKMPFGVEDTNLYNIKKHENDLIIFVGGAGCPYFSTDTISVINAVATNSDMILKATKTDGVYDKDPELFNNAIHLSHITYEEAISKSLGIMDQTAFIMAMQHKIPIKIFSIYESNCFTRAVQNDIRCSIIK